MSVYIWEGPEEPLAHSCTTSRFVIETLDESKRQATGSINICDYVEHGIVGEDHWKATLDTGTGWKVTPVNAFWHDDTGAPLFGLNSSVNTAMDQFIANRLNWFIQHHGWNQAKEISDRPPAFTGKFEPYTGPCVCAQLQATLQPHQLLFPWAELTRGNAPQRCFKCSCGRRWWLCDPPTDQWAPICEDAAWQMLVKHNGIMMRPLTTHPNPDMDMGLYLLETIRSEGYIPIG